MDDKERYDRGMAKRRQVLGDDWVDRANARKTAFNEEFQDFITRTAWGEIWTRPHYDERTRRWYRIRSANLTPEGISFSDAEDDLTYQDHQAYWPSKTYTQVQSSFGAGFTYQLVELTGLYGNG